MCRIHSSHFREAQSRCFTHIHVSHHLSTPSFQNNPMLFGRSQCFTVPVSHLSQSFTSTSVSQSRLTQSQSKWSRFGELRPTPLTCFNVCLWVHDKGNQKRMGGKMRATERRERTDETKKEKSAVVAVLGAFGSELWACQMMSGREKQEESVLSPETWKFTPLTYLTWMGPLPPCSSSTHGWKWWGDETATITLKMEITWNLRGGREAQRKMTLFIP